VTFFDGDGAGTLVAERWVLTAANIPRGHRIRVAGRATQLTRVIVHPGRVATPPAPIDLALVRLDPPATGVPILAPFADDDEAGLQNAAPHSDGREIHGKDGLADQIPRATSGITRGDRCVIRYGYVPGSTVR
jgi:Trypsin